MFKHGWMHACVHVYPYTCPDSCLHACLHTCLHACLCTIPLRRPHVLKLHTILASSLLVLPIKPSADLPVLYRTGSLGPRSPFSGHSLNTASM